ARTKQTKTLQPFFSSNDFEVYTSSFSFVSSICPAEHFEQRETCIMFCITSISSNKSLSTVMAWILFYFLTKDKTTAAKLIMAIAIVAYRYFLFTDKFRLLNSNCSFCDTKSL